jgi:hypothetical protein
MPSDHNCLWRRLDTPGHDACRYLHDGLGWVIEGAAVFLTGGLVANLSYRLRCDDDWVSRSASVQGWIGGELVSIEIARAAGNGWTVDDREIPELAGFTDIDLGFTPATNANAIRRLALGVGEQGETRAVWLDDCDWTVKPLPQTYRRTAALDYDYAAPSHHFRARLQIDAFGAVTEYPHLWTRETAPALATSAPAN